VIGSLPRRGCDVLAGRAKPDEQVAEMIAKDTEDVRVRNKAILGPTPKRRR